MFTPRLLTLRFGLFGILVLQMGEEKLGVVFHI
jgi:hypothetical protein